MAGFFNRLFGSKSAESVSLSVLERDLHSHLIPGIDDGAKTLEDSLEMIRGLVELGYKGAITTPHVMSDAYRNSPETIREGLEKVKAAVSAEGIEFQLDCAAEYYLDEGFEDKLEAEEELMTFGGEHKYLLFETSYTDRPLYMESRIFQLKTQGYMPVLAHPERYSYHWDKGKETFAELREKGVLFQVNISSFSGHYSTRAAKIANSLAEWDFIDFLGTDIHRVRQFGPLKKALKENRHLKRLLQTDRLLNRTL